MHCEAHPFEEALAVLLLLGLMSPAWCCLWLGTVPLPAHTAVGSSSVLRLPELWSNSHCMTSSCVLQGWVRAGVRILLSRVHVPHLVPLHPLSWSKQILPLHLIKSNGAEQEPNTNVSCETAKLSVAGSIQGLQSFPAGSALWQPLQRSHSAIIAAGTRSNKILAFFVLVCAAGGLFSTSLCAHLSSHSFQRPFPPMAAIPTAAHPSPPAHCCAAAPGPVLHYVGICPAGFLLRKPPGFLLLLQTLIDSQTFSMKWHQWKETKVPVFPDVPEAVKWFVYKWKSRLIKISFCTFRGVKPPAAVAEAHCTEFCRTMSVFFMQCCSFEVTFSSSNLFAWKRWHGINHPV